mgnify:CR=1 FL=1
MIRENRKVSLRLHEAAQESQRREIEILEKEVVSTEPHVFSNEFNRKMDKLLNFSKKPYFNFVNTVGKRAAVIIIAFITALSITTFSVKAFREPVVNFSISVYEKFSNILFHADEPEYLPDGYNLKENNNFGNVIEIIYSNRNDDLFFEQYIISSTQIGADTEGTDIEMLTVDGKEILFYNNKGVNRIIWTDGSYGYKVIGVIDKYEIMKMIKLTKY